MKQAAKRLALFFCALYTLTSFAFSFCMMMEGGAVTPVQYVKLTAMFLVLYLITLLRAFLDTRQWGLAKSYLAKRLLFLPLYLLATLGTLLWFGEPFAPTAEDALFICGVFLVTFLLMTALAYPRMKKQEAAFAESLAAYQKTLEKEQR